MNYVVQVNVSELKRVLSEHGESLESIEKYIQDDKKRIKFKRECKRKLLIDGVIDPKMLEFIFRMSDMDHYEMEGICPDLYYNGDFFWHVHDNDDPDDFM